MINLDEKDKKILQILKEHAEYTTRQIAKKTLLPITTVHNRIKRLKSQGIIKKFTIQTDYSKLDKGFAAYILVSANLERLKQTKRTQYDLASELLKNEFVESADIVSGGTDLVVKMRSKDVSDFDKNLLSKIQMVDGIEKTQSLIVLHESRLNH